MNVVIRTKWSALLCRLLGHKWTDPTKEVVGTCYIFGGKTARYYGKACRRCAEFQVVMGLKEARDFEEGK